MKTLAHSPYPARVPGLYYVHELDFLMTYCFPTDFSLDTTAFVFYPKKSNNNNNNQGFHVIIALRYSELVEL